MPWHIEGPPYLSDGEILEYLKHYAAKKKRQNPSG